MDTGSQVTFRCRYCGGEAVRNKNTYFALCPYCGMQVGFDELKEEAQVEFYRQRAQDLEQSSQGYFANRDKLKAWLKLRNRFYIFIFVMHFFAWLLIGYDAQTEQETHMWLGMICLIFALVVGGVFLPLMAMDYPEFNILTGQVEKGRKGKMALKLIGTCLLLCVGSVILAFVVIAIFSVI